MRKLKLLFAAALVMGGLTASAQTDVTASYIGDVARIVNGGGWHGSCSNNHKESDGIGWWNSQTISGSHAFANPTSDGATGESWSPEFGTAGVMMGRTMVLPSGSYTLSFDAFACNATNSTDPGTLPSAGDAVAFLTGKTDVDITNTATAGDGTFHNVSFTFDVTTDNTAYEFGIKKLTDASKIDWCQIKNVKLTLNSTDIFPVPNNAVSSFTYSGSQAWHTNTWSTEGQWDGSRFQVPFHELWVASGGQLADATITGTYTPTQTGVYKVSAWVRAQNEAGGDISGVKIFVGDAQTDVCTGASVNGGKGRLGTYTAMADGVNGTAFNYGFILEGSTVNWLSFKNVTITYLGSLPADEVSALISQAEALEALEMDAAVKSALTSAKEALESNGSVANFNALASAIVNATASAEAYALFVPEKAKALALGMTEEAVAALAPNVKELKVAEYNYVTTNYPYSVNLGTWTTNNATDRSGQHWDGTETSTYSEQNAGWGDNSWTCSYSQNLNLPAGKYVFKVAGRKSSDGATLTLTVKNGEVNIGTVNDFPNGDVGLGINTSGATDYTSGEGHTYANNNNGRGWEWRYVQFTLTEPATVNVAVTASATAKYNWVGFCNATVQTDDADNVELMEALVALNDAKAAATLTKNTNAGTGVFQLDETTNNNLWNAYETAKAAADDYTFTASSTASEVNALVTALTTAISNYQNQALNAPSAEKRYTLTIVEAGKDWNGNAVTFIAGARDDAGLYGLKYLAPANSNLNQALKFTAVEGETNTFKISAINVETGAEQYITTGATYGGTNTQIRTTDDATKASWVKIAVTATENQFQLLNVSDGNKVIANNNNNDMYTANSANFTIAEASQASIALNITSTVKYGTRIFPFTPELPSGVKAYSCEAAEGTVLTLVEVETPAANTPYILENTTGANVSETKSGWGVASSLDVTAGWLTGVYEAKAAPVGSFVLQNNNNKVGFYLVAENKQPTVGANRCYLSKPATEGARAAYFFSEDGTTGISAIEALTAGDVQIFNAAGAQQPRLQKGVNIIRKADGTSYKVMVK